MEKTKRLCLVLPNEDDAYNISVFNDNFRIIDEKGGSTEELDKLLTDDKTCLVNAINEVFQLGGDVKQSLVTAIKTADPNIKISADNTIDEICKAIIQIAKNWETKDLANRKMISDVVNKAETTDVAGLYMYATWENIGKFITQYLTNG